MKTKKEQWIVYCLILLYIIYFTWFTFQKHELFLTGRYDLGNMDQTVWNTFHGRIFSFTNPDSDEITSRLAVHADFILILLAPFYAIWSNSKILLLIQTVVIAFGALFVYLLSKKYIKQRALPVILALSYLLNPYVERQNIFDFHAVSLATTFLLGAFYFIENDNMIAFFIFVLLAVLTKEHIFLIAAMLGIYLFIFKKKKWGVILAITCSIIFYLLVQVFIPHARGQGNAAPDYYKSLGGSAREIIITVLTNPIKVLSIIWKNKVLTYLGLLFAPVGYLSILAPGYFLFALPEFLVNILSSDSAFRSYYYHYAAASIPFIYISTIYGLKKIIKKFPSKKTYKIITIYTIVAAIISAWSFGPLPGAQRADLSVFQSKVNAKAIHTYLNKIPRQTPVASTNNLGAQLVHRKKIYSLTTGLKKANLILFLVPEINDETDQNVQLIQQLRQNKSFHIDYQLNNFIVFKRNKPI